MHQELLEKARYNMTGWDQMPAAIKFEDLDHDEIMKTFEECKARGRIKKGVSVKNPKEVLHLLGLLVGEDITNAAAVLFCKEPGIHYIQCGLKLAYFNDIEKRNIVDNKQVNGNIFVLIEEAENFFLRHISIAGRFIPGKFARIDEPDYPPKAFREAILNAFAHRDHTIQGGSVGVMMYKDRIEIYSHGKLPPGIVIEELNKQHTSHPRNKLILNTLYRRGEIEELGIGIQDMIFECKSLGIPEPEFIENGNTFIVILRKKIILKDESIPENNSTTEDIALNERQNLILLALQAHKSLTRSKLRDLLNQGGKEIQDRTLQRDLSLLKNHALINSEGKGPNTRWFIA